MPVNLQAGSRNAIKGKRKRVSDVTAYTGLTKKQTTTKKSHFSLLGVGNNLLQFTGTTVQKFIAYSQREPFTHPAEQKR